MAFFGYAAWLLIGLGVALAPTSPPAAFFLACGGLVLLGVDRALSN